MELEGLQNLQTSVVLHTSEAHSLGTLQDTDGSGTLQYTNGLLKHHDHTDHDFEFAKSCYCLLAFYLNDNLET